jgi:murein DD-endopeptidase MepM/ murein hydrolase activator NlpD
MRRLACLLAAALATLAGAAGATGAPPVRVFTVVPSTAAVGLPSAEVPNGPGTIALPPAYLAPRESEGLAFPALNGLWHRAGAAYGIPWQVLAAINKIESNFGRNMGPSSAGAIGWMQFMPSTWLRWGTDANADGVADPWNAEDAIFSAARYLAAAGGRTDLQRGIFAYNHAQWYVDDVLELAGLYRHGGADLAFSLDRVQVRLDEARRAVAGTNRKLVAAARAKSRLAGRAERLFARADRAELLSGRLALLKQAVQADARRHEAAAALRSLREDLREAEQTLAAARSSSWTSAFAPGGAALVAGPSYLGDYVFPVGGGPATVSVGRDHHDYPAADIAAPSGTPLYSLTDGFVLRAWHLPSGRCGIGFTLRAGDGRKWTYCHLSHLEPAVQSGVALSAGAPVGLVGSTGNSSGPHLHLQLEPAISYPQQEAWFQGFAGNAFRWQDEATPVFSSGAATAPVFTLVDAEPAPEDGTLIAFTLERS